MYRAQSNGLLYAKKKMYRTSTVIEQNAMHISDATFCHRLYYLR